MNSRQILLAVLLISITFNIILVISFISPEMISEEESSKRLPYLSKRIFAEKQNDIIINFVPLRGALREFIGRFKIKTGVYFEYLPSGVSIGVNDREEVKLVSLAKVPLTMSVYEQIEKGAWSPEKKFVIQESQLDKKFGSLWEKGLGAELSVEELVYVMLTESDNTAFNVLWDALSVEAINNVYDALDIPVIQNPEEEFSFLVSPKNYSSIFRSLYLSSYLSKEYSNKILKTLTETKFNDQIPAGVPPEIKISHKIGGFEKGNTIPLYIDCGIIYVPSRPYILCMFVDGPKKDADFVMKNISAMVYTYVSQISPSY